MLLESEMEELDIFEHMDLDGQPGLNLFGHQMTEYPELQLDVNSGYRSIHYSLSEEPGTLLEAGGNSPSPSPVTSVSWLLPTQHSNSSSYSYSPSFSPNFNDAFADSRVVASVGSSKGRPKKSATENQEEKLSTSIEKTTKKRKQRATPHRKWWAQLAAKDPNLALLATSSTAVATATKTVTEIVEMKSSSKQGYGTLSTSTMSSQMTSPLVPLDFQESPKSSDKRVRSEMPVEAYQPDTPASSRELQRLRSEIARQREQDMRQRQQDIASGLTTINATKMEATKLATMEATKLATMEATKLATMEATKLATMEATKLATMEATKLATMEATKLATMEATKLATMEATKLATMEATKLATMEATKLATMEATKLATMEATKLASTAVEASFVASSHSSNQVAELKKLLAKSCYQTALMFKQRDEELTRKATEWDNSLAELKQFAMMCQQDLERLSSRTCIHCSIHSEETQQQLSL